MPYTHLPKVGVSYGDGNLRTRFQSAQPKVLVIAPADTGLTYEVFGVSSIAAAEREFGSDTPLLKGLHEAAGAGADNLALMRCGGKQGKVVFTDSGADTLTITPDYRGSEILERYALIVLQESGANRYLIWDTEDDTFVFDSHEILVLNNGIVDVDDTGIGLFTCGDINDPLNAPTLAALATGDFTPVGAITATSVVATAGTDGLDVSLVEKYAGLNTAYHVLDFRDADYVIPKGVFIDDQNVADGDSCNFFKGVPAPGASNDSLGYLWQYIYQGKLYTYFVDRADYFAAAGTAAQATVTVSTDIVLTADKDGTGGNSITIDVNAAGAAGPTVTISEPTATSLRISVVDDGTATTSATVTAINLALGLYTMANGKLASSIVTASGGSVALLTTVVSTPLAGGLGGHVLTHEDLTGDEIPAAVSTRFAAGEDSELREVNFAHQLASFCYLASTEWKDMFGAISVKAPTSWATRDIAEWVGEAPTITVIGLDDAIDAPTDNGSGLFSIKLMGGKSQTSNGYRADLIEDGNTTDGYAFGGLILTVGASLTNGSDWPYGISDGDEALDASGTPVDIGKHISVFVDWPIHRNNYNGGVNYRGSMEALAVGLLVSQVPDNEEPISVNYPIRKITSVPRIHSTQIDTLAQYRFCVLRREEGVGYIFANISTAAHPQDSDYTNISTVRCINRLAKGIRRIAKPYFGKPFDSYRVASLQQEVDAFLGQERVDGFHNGARAPISYTKTGRVLGKLTFNLSVVPTFVIKQIDVPISLSADEADLG